MPPVPGSIEKYFGEIILQIPRVLAVVLLSRLCTADSAILVLFRGSLLLYYTLWNTAVLQVFQGPVLRVLPSIGSISSGCYCEYWSSTRRSTKTLSISAVYWEYEVYSDHLSVHRRFDNFILILLQTAFTVHGWSHECELMQIAFGEGTGILGVLAVFLEYMLRALAISTGSTLLIL